MKSNNGTVCVVAHGWPRLSTTFVAQELAGLEQEGLNLWLATYGPPDAIRQKIHERVQAPVFRLPKPAPDLLSMLKAWAKVRKRPGYQQARAMFRAETAHGLTMRRIRAFLRGILLAAELPKDVRLIYAHFLDSPTSVARYAATIAELPLAASAHARDIWTAHEWDLRAKLSQLEWCATCTQPGADRLRELSDRPDKVHLVYHGLSFDRFPVDPPARSQRDGSDQSDPVRLLSVGRAVEKKGFDVMIEALGMLPKDLAWRWHHVGEGKLRTELQERARAIGIADRIEWHGAEEQASVIRRYRECDLFVLPSREAADGDRDGLPNVLMEAQSQGLACLATSFSAIPELIIDGETGVLVPPENAEALAAAMEHLIRSPQDRSRLGQAGYARVRTDFESEAGIRRLAALIRQSMA